jgi:serine/threonine-protein kinase
MGAVWVARHLKLNEPVAVKFMQADLHDSDGAHTRFEREATAVAQLQRKTHHVVNIHDYGIDHGMPYIVMELLDGETLHERLKRVHRIALSSALEIVIQLCKALRPAHEAGIVHRDIKPSNVFIARISDEEIVKVLDFGLAKGEALEVQGESTRTGDILGSPHYMSPEQATGEGVIDARSDLWSTAVLIYRAITGELPFPGSKFGEILVKVARDPFTPPSQLVIGIPRGVDAFFAKALAKHPAQRFQSARDMAMGFATAVGELAQLSGSFRQVSPSYANVLIRDSGPGLSEPPPEGIPRSDRAPVHDIPTTPLSGAHPSELHAPPSFPSGSLIATALPQLKARGRTVALAGGGFLLLLVTLALALAGGAPEHEAQSFEPALSSVTDAVVARAVELEVADDARRRAERAEAEAERAAAEATSAAAAASAAASADAPTASSVPTPAPPRPVQRSDCPPGGFHPLWGYRCPAR